MRKTYVTVLALSFALLLQSCGFVGENKANPVHITKKHNESNPYRNIEKYRTIYVEGDSLLLHPFEAYREMKFEGVQCGLFFYLGFSDGRPDTQVLFSDNFTPFSYDGEFGDNLSWEGSTATIHLASLNDTLNKILVKGQTYKLIYSYKQDDAVLRSNVPTENVSGYYIIDITLPGQKFERQKPYQY